MKIKHYILIAVAILAIIVFITPAVKSAEEHAHVGVDVITYKSSPIKYIISWWIDKMGGEKTICTTDHTDEVA